MAGIGPSQFCGMLLADISADILRIARPQSDSDGIAIPTKYNLMDRSRQTLEVDLKKPEGVDLVLTLCKSARFSVGDFRHTQVEPSLSSKQKACLSLLKSRIDWPGNTARASKCRTA